MTFHIRMGLVGIPECPPERAAIAIGDTVVVGPAKADLITSFSRKYASLSYTFSNPEEESKKKKDATPKKAPKSADKKAKKGESEEEEEYQDSDSDGDFDDGAMGNNDIVRTTRLRQKN